MYRVCAYVYFYFVCAYVQVYGRIVMHNTFTSRKIVDTVIKYKFIIT